MMKALIEEVNNWVESKNLENESTPLDQMWKMVEEAQELEAAIMNNSIDDIEDELGDVMFCCIVQAKMQGLDPQRVLERVVAKVTRRTGKMVNGMFVKDAY